MTLRIELFFTKSKNWSFFTNMTHSKNSSLLNLFIWLKELNTFLNMTQWVGLVSKWLKEFNLFLKMTQRIEPFPQNDSNFLFFGFDSELIFWLWLLEWYCFVYYDSNKPFFFSLIRPKGLNFFYWLIWPKGFFLTWVTESNTWTRKNWTFFFHDTKNWTLFEDYLTPRFKTFVNREMELYEFGSRNWGLFNNITQKWLTLFGHDSQSWTFFQHDSQNWTLLKNMIHRDWTLLYNMTRKWVHFLVWLQDFFF